MLAQKLSLIYFGKKVLEVEKKINTIWLDRAKKKCNLVSTRKQDKRTSGRKKTQEMNPGIVSAEKEREDDFLPADRNPIFALSARKKEKGKP